MTNALWVPILGVIIAIAVNAGMDVVGLSDANVSIFTIAGNEVIT